MPFRFLEGLTMADIAFEATGRTRDEMFESAADALIKIQVEDPRLVRPSVMKELSLEADDIERLLHDFLQELIFYKDAELLVFSKCAARIADSGGKVRLDATLSGEQIDPKRHPMLVDAKAVSWHRFNVEETRDGWKAVVIIDV